MDNTACLNKLILKTEKEIRLLYKSEVLYCEGDGSYSFIHTLEKGRFIVSKYLKELEEELPEKNFFRLHKKYIINLDHLEYIKKDTQQVTAVLKNGVLLPVAFRRVADLKRMISGRI